MTRLPLTFRVSPWIAVAALVLTTSFLNAAHAETPPGDGPVRDIDVGAFGPLQAGRAPGEAAPSPSQEQEATTRFAWPLAWPLSHPRLRIVNYVDHDPTFGDLDYEGGDLAYDGHLGTDLNLNSFRDMDAGVPVLAAANGRVVFVWDGEYDRQINAPRAPGNGVRLLHEDGTTSLYWHIRTNSATVQNGEYVREGQVLGLVGSAGLTEMPHLHFEVAEWSITSSGFHNTPRDPWSGTANPIPSLWRSQEPYVGDEHLRVHDLGVTTGRAFNDEGGFGDRSAFKERPSQPVVFGADEPTLMVWVLVSGQFGDPYDIVVHRPDGSTYTRVNDFRVTPDARAWGRGWQYMESPFSGTVLPADYGEWSAQVLSGGVAVRTVFFTVGETSRYEPRFHWIGGKSFHLSTERQQDVLSLSYLGAPMSDVVFTLENAPSNVSLSTDEEGQMIVLIDPAGPDLAGVRSRDFAVLATDPFGYQDRMHYHLVNYAASTLGSPPAVSAPSTVSAYEGDILSADISASDAEGDAIAGLTADLRGLPPGHAAAFTAGPGNTTGRLTWPTKPGDEGVYAVTFTARTSLGAVGAGFNYPPIVQSGSATTTIEVNRAMEARAFTTGGDRTLRLSSDRPWWCVNMEPLNGDFSLADIDLSTVELVSRGTGPIDRILMKSDRKIVVEDKDRNSVEDIALCFGKEDLRNLFGGVGGRQSLTATVDGALTSGARFSAPVPVDVIAAEIEEDAASISPNPLNPEAVLRLRLSHAGPVRVGIYDTQGRLVRTLLDTRDAPAGPLELRVDARDGSGRALGSGVYFFQVSTRDGVTSGRFVVLK